MKCKHTYGPYLKASIVACCAFAWLCCCGPAASVTPNTIVAGFGNAPDDSNSTFSIVLRNRGPLTTISGFAFKIAYRSDQVRLSGVINNTGQLQAKVEYGLGSPQRASLPDDTDTYQILTMTTLRNLSHADQLAELVFDKKPGFDGRFHFHIEDRTTQPVDGLLGGDFANIEHTFDTNTLQKAGH